MEQKWLRVKTEAGQPPHRAALHMLLCNSDRALRKVVLDGKVDPLADQGRTPLVHVAGAALLERAPTRTGHRMMGEPSPIDGRWL